MRRLALRYFVIRVNVCTRFGSRDAPLSAENEDSVRKDVEVMSE